MKAQTWEDFVAEEIKVPPSLMGGGLLVPQGRLIIYGASDQYKSFATKQLCACLASGEPWFGFEVGEAVTTLYVQAELPPQKEQERTQALLEVTPTNGKAYTMTLRDTVFGDRGKWMELLSVVKETGAGFLVLDPLVMFQEGSESRDTDVKNFLRPGLDWVGNQGKVATSIVHHENKPQLYEGQEVDRGINALSGWGGFVRWADTIIRFKRTGLPDTVEMSFPKTRYRERPEPKWLTFNKEKLILEVSKHDPWEVARVVLAAGEVGSTELNGVLMEECGVGQTKAKELKKAWEEAGKIKVEVDKDDKRKKVVRLA